jgi:CubicO group peptidase (beta-lactamase class C family)
MKNMILSLVAFQLVMLLFNPLKTTAQEAKSLKHLEGYYQFQQNKDTYLQITSQGSQLVLTQLWDEKKLVFNQESDLSFVNKEMPMFTLEFKKDSTGAIIQVIAFGMDIWERNNGYTPPKAEVLNAEETKELKKNLWSAVSALAKAINSNSSDQITAFVKAYGDEGLQHSVDQFINSAHDIRNTGGIDFYAETSLQPGRRKGVYLFKGRILGDFYELSLALNKSSKITFLHSQEVGGPVTPVQKYSNEKDLIASLNKTLSALNQKDIFSGTVLVAKGNKVILEYACGEAIKPNHIKNTINTRFNLGSINKMFTATSIMQLLEQGKLKLNDPISLYLDTTWLPSAISDIVSIHHLLSHTSGLGDFFGEEFSKTPKEAIIELKDYQPFVKMNTLAFKPGTNWLYSNSGMILLGAIIEKVSSMNYFDYVKQYVYKPAGMTATDSYNMANPPQDIAHGYIPQADGSFEDNLNSNGFRGTSAGGGYSTVGDLYKFAVALHSGQLVSTSSRALMFTDHLNRQYGYGVQLQYLPIGKAVGHTGGAPGINGVLYSIPEKDYHIVVLTNYHRAAQRVANYLLRVIQ